MTMPRKATDTVTEHRITLGDYERAELSKMLQAQRVDEDLDLVLEIVKSLALPVSIGAAAFMIYHGLIGLSLGKDFIQEKVNAFVAEQEAAAADPLTPVPTGAPPTTPRSPDVNRGWSWANVFASGLSGAL